MKLKEYVCMCMCVSQWQKQARTTVAVFLVCLPIVAPRVTSPSTSVMQKGQGLFSPFYGQEN